MSMSNPDKALRVHVLDELDWAPDVDADHIGVAVSDGVVTLSGPVTSVPQKRAAERAAFRVAGVRAVANGLEIDLPEEHERSDTDIAKAAVRAIEWHAEIPAEDIHIRVDDGWVTLEGTVPEHYQRDRAEEIVRPLMGVRGVTNHLELEFQPAPDDLHERIRAALERQADRDADRIRISVNDGSVTLDGTVEWWAEREDAEAAVWAAPGVRQVKNNLKVKGEAYSS